MLVQFAHRHPLHITGARLQCLNLPLLCRSLLYNVEIVLFCVLNWIQNWLFLFTKRHEPSSLQTWNGIAQTRKYCRLASRTSSSIGQPGSYHGDSYSSFINVHFHSSNLPGTSQKCKLEAKINDGTFLHDQLIRLGWLSLRPMCSPRITE